jgi:hypothetical protein
VIDDLRRLFRIVAVLCVTFVGFYGVYTGILYFQFSNSYHRWLDHKIGSYSISVHFGKSEHKNISSQSQVVRNGKVVEGFDKFRQPVIDWAFDQARFCVPAWILCAVFGWSFEYEPTYGYPSQIEYNEYDGHYTIILSNIMPLPEQNP